jgi:predicted cupin superfamily sugar epimerase
VDFFRRTYSCSHKAKIDRGERNFGDAIYYLITPDQFSKLHKLKLDEMWHFYAGDPIEMVQLKDNKLELFELGNSDFSKHKPQVLVPANTWQGARLKKGGKFALVGTKWFPCL